MTEKETSGSHLHQSEERFRLLVASVRDYAIFMLDPNGYVLTWNAGAERLKGYRPEEIIGRHFSTFYPPEALARKLPEQELEVAASTGSFEERAGSGRQHWLFRGRGLASAPGRHTVLGQCRYHSNA